MDFRALDILPVSQRPLDGKGWIVLALQDKQRLLLLAQVGLPCGVGSHVGAIVVEQVFLDTILAGAAEEGRLVGPGIGIVLLRMGIVAEMPLPGGLGRNEVGAELFDMRAAIRPILPSRFPQGAKPRLVRHRVLHDDGVDTPVAPTHC